MVVLIALLILAAGVGFGLNEVYAGAKLAAAIEQYGREGKPELLLVALATPSLKVDPEPAVGLLVEADYRKGREELLSRLEGAKSIS